MPDPDSTSWELLEAAAAGSPRDREEFARRYQPLVRNWLLARWKNPSLREQVPDVVQEVFVQCFKPDGALRSATERKVASFRGFLLGVARNIASRHESKATRRHRLLPMTDAELDEQPGTESSISRPIDREWARSLLREAAQRMGKRAERLGAPAQMRVEILRQRFQDNLSIPEVAQRLGKPPSVIHHQFAKARSEFRKSLEEVLQERSPGKQEDLLATCRWLMDLLG